jgi:cardiolipin synthase
MANALTLARIALIAPFAAMFFIAAPWAMLAALALFVIAALTDLFDGMAARSTGRVTALGAALDPLADKMLIAAALLLLTRNGIIRDAGVIAALIMLMRELFVGGMREAVGQKGETLPVTGLAKLKTMAQLVAIGLLIAAAPGGLGGEAMRPFAAAALWFAAVLTVWTGVDYGRRAVRILRSVT